MAGIYCDGMDRKEYAFGAGYMPDGSCRIVAGDIGRQRVRCHEFTDDMNVVTSTNAYDSMCNTVWSGAEWGKRLSMFYSQPMKGSATMVKHRHRYEKSAWWWLHGANKSTVDINCRVTEFRQVEMRGMVKSFR